MRKVVGWVRKHWFVCLLWLSRVFLLPVAKMQLVLLTVWSWWRTLSILLGWAGFLEKVVDRKECQVELLFLADKLQPRLHCPLDRRTLALQALKKSQRDPVPLVDRPLTAKHLIPENVYCGQRTHDDYLYSIGASLSACLSYLFMGSVPCCWTC